ARNPAWIWDMRGFWADERIETGVLRTGSIPERMMRAVERGAARRADGIVTLSAAALDVLEMRYGHAIRAKSRAITTCVELGRFPISAMPPARPYRLLLAGTLSKRYDVGLTLRFVDELRLRCDVEMSALIPGPSPWDLQLRQAGIEPRSA